MNRLPKVSYSMWYVLKERHSPNKKVEHFRSFDYNKYDKGRWDNVLTELQLFLDQYNYQVEWGYFENSKVLPLKYKVRGKNRCFYNSKVESPTNIEEFLACQICKTSFTKEILKFSCPHKIYYSVVELVIHEHHLSPDKIIYRDTRNNLLITNANNQLFVVGIYKNDKNCHELSAGDRSLAAKYGFVCLV
jgi:hypothetical protein